MRKELLRQGVHFLYGIGFTFVAAYNLWIALAVTLALVLGSLAHRKRELPFIAPILARLDRNEEIPAFGAITLSAGITSVFFILPAQGIAAGLGVAIIDSLATAIGIVASGRGKQLAASAVGGVAFFIVATSIFSNVPTLYLGIAALGGALAEFLTQRSMIFDDNITVPWVVAIVLALL